MSLTKQIEDLCQAASKEQDGKKLLSLVDELNRELQRLDTSAAEKKEVKPENRPLEGRKKADAA